jgi:hypothetical protein
MRGDLLFGGLVAAYAAGSTAAVAQVTARDSAGVRIVENALPSWPRGREWTLSAQPVVDIGAGQDSLDELATVMGATRLSDGSIAIANMGTNTIKLFDARGRYVRSIGRRGQGPGEFRQVMGIARMPGDTIAAIDSREEVEFFGVDGRFARGLRSPSRKEGLVVTGFHFFDDGSFARTSWPQAYRQSPGRWQDSLVVFRMTPTDTGGSIVSRHPAMEFTRTATLPFSQPVTFAPAGFIVSAGSAYWVAYADRYEIRRHRLDGRLELIVRAPWTPQPVRNEDRARYREFIINLGAEGGGRVDARLGAQRQKMMEEVEFARNLPAYQFVVVDGERNLWLSNVELEWFLSQGFARVTSGPTAWRVFDATGRWLGTVPMPARFRPMEIGRDYVLGLWRDTEDVEHVRLYRLTKP